ncbi:WG repeat-containing protein [Micromonospora sp. WMMA1998]|uniref:WG repeat-containing protein n=1 Tax=Micromonospora sp. WMMA1998 TaxID=3015167 RepID=UPI00248AE863|nr:WG repeat-containing protein [Micromonospora sp. WMMA1998]WBC17166.1 WG repeat-containing protein [Micromonospora sp. WMMA1998]
MSSVDTAGRTGSARSGDTANGVEQHRTIAPAHPGQAATEQAAELLAATAETATERAATDGALAERAIAEGTDPEPSVTDPPVSEAGVPQPPEPNAAGVAAAVPDSATTVEAPRTDASRPGAEPRPPTPGPGTPSPTGYGGTTTEPVLGDGPRPTSAPPAPASAPSPSPAGPAPTPASFASAGATRSGSTDAPTTTTTNQNAPTTPASTTAGQDTPATAPGTTAEHSDTSTDGTDAGADRGATTAEVGAVGASARTEDDAVTGAHGGEPDGVPAEPVRGDAAAGEGPTVDAGSGGPAGSGAQEAGPEAEASAPEPAPPVDPEQALAAVGWRLHPGTLREEAPDPDELRRIRDGLTGKLDTALDNRSRARLLSLRSVASRVLGDLDDAVADARLALTYAEATGELRRTALARARLAEVLRWRGEHAEADRLFAEANSPELPDRLRALLHEHAGRCCFDQGRLTEACLHFERALDLRQGEDGPLNARTVVALDAVAERAADGGFGPAPRTREEILGTPRWPVPTFDEEQQLWGYADADGELVVGYRYAEAQPFHEGLAWVRRPEASRWALIDSAGAALIEANNGYRAVGPFSEGLSWVSMDGKGRWMAVDQMNIVKIPPGYEEARPFRNGLAAVRQNGGWGAVDRTGAVVVPTRYHGLGTSLADGRHLDGFTSDGLAVVELAGRRGVVDRGGRVVVAPAYPTLVVHPVAFLVTTESGRWGALDRRGEPLIDPVHRARAEVAAEIDRLLTDASPVL